MTGNIVAGRYAKALFALGKKGGMEQAEAFGRTLGGLVAMTRMEPQLLEVFRNPLFSTDEKRQVVTRALDRVGAERVVVNFCLLLADKGRLGLLPVIEFRYSALLDAEKGVLRGRMITAVALGDAKRRELKARLEQQSGRSVVLDFEVDPAILGGVVLKMGDSILDASLRAQLGILKENIKRGE